MEEKLVSAVVITHNRKDLVQKAIQSVLNQTYKPMELIVVDDASDDTTRELLTQLSLDKGFQYIYIPKEESRGGNHARNVGILQAKGEYIALLDDDDEWLPEKTAKQAAYLDAHPDIAVVSCGRITETNFKKRIPVDLATLPEGDLREAAWTRMLFLSSSMMVRRTALLEIGMFDEELRFWQDTEMLIRLMQISHAGMLREHLYLYRVIKTDQNRLTNKLDGWEAAVHYIENKHQDLLEALSTQARRSYETKVARDGMVRAATCRNFRKRNEYLKRCCELQPGLKNCLYYHLVAYRHTYFK